MRGEVAPSSLRENINHSWNVLLVPRSFKLCPRPLGDPCPLSSALNNPMGILQPYGKEESITGPMKVLDAMWERNESHLSGVWRSKQLGSNEGCHQKSQRAVLGTKEQANHRIGANVWRNRQARFQVKQERTFLTTRTAQSFQRKRSQQPRWESLTSKEVKKNKGQCASWHHQYCLKKSHRLSPWSHNSLHYFIIFVQSPMPAFGWHFSEIWFIKIGRLVSHRWFISTKRRDIYV